MTVFLETVITGIFTGSPEQRWEGKAPRAIRKTARTDRLLVTATGLSGDEQADKTVHGGLEKAIHHYSTDHMAHWQQAFPDNAGQFVPGCFGENISANGLNEANLCLGDILSLGDATVQICQGRQPCWKLNLHTGLAAMAPSFQKTGFTGWYYRVLETGEVGAGDSIRLVDRPHADWQLSRLIAARFSPTLSPDIAAELAEMTVLAEAWRSAFARKMQPDYQEDTSRRLKG